MTRDKTDTSQGQGAITGAFQDARFLFASEALPDTDPPSSTSPSSVADDALHVVRFRGTEGLSVLYSFDILIVTRRPSLPLEAMLSHRARLTIKHGRPQDQDGGQDEGQDAVFSGFLTRITQVSRHQGWTFYELTLQPGLWYCTQSVQNNFFIGKNVQGILETCLGKLAHTAYEFRLQGTYPVQDFSMQHNESLYDYMAWKMEREGIYYYFEEKDGREQVVFTDSKLAHVPLPGTSTLRYAPASGLDALHGKEIVTSFALNCLPLPQWVILRDYDWRNPNRPVEGKSLVSDQGLGEVYYYGEGFASEAEGNRLAEIRAASLRCHAKIFSGTSAVPTLRPGYSFTLTHHYDPAFNQEYTLVSVTHEGSQEARLARALGIPLGVGGSAAEAPGNPESLDGLSYHNTFSCIPASMQFRPRRQAKRSKVSGMITAFIDAAGESAVAEINAQGCYKVVFPQDTSSHSPGNASCWVRRMQPHVGQGHGFSFPLTPGVEVLIAFLDGDPDRPVIAGAVRNAESGFLETPASAQAMGIQSVGGSGLAFNDQNGKPGLVLGTGGRSALMMSAGSTDTLVKFSDNAFDTYTSYATVEAGIAHCVRGGFQQGLRADNAVFSTSQANIVKLLQKAASGLNWGVKYVTPDSTEGMSDEDKQKTANELDALSYSATLIKTFCQLFFTTKTAQGLLQGADYSAVLASDNSASHVTLRTDVTASAIAKYVAFWAMQFLTRDIFDAASLGLGIEATEGSYSKRSLGRSYTAATLPSLLSEITAVAALFLAKNTKKPSGVLLNSQNGPLAGIARDESVLLSGKGIGLAAFEEMDKAARLFKPDSFAQRLGVPKNGIALNAEEIRGLAAANIDLFAAGEVRAAAPTISLSTRENADNAQRLEHLSRHILPAGVVALNKAAGRCQTMTSTHYGSLEITSSPAQSVLTLENSKGSMTIRNAAKKDSDSLTIEHKCAAAGRSYVFSANDDACFVGEDGSTGLSLDKDGSMHLANAKQQGLHFKAQDQSCSLTSKKVEVQGTDAVSLSAAQLSLDAKNQLKAKVGKSGFVCTVAQAQITGDLVRIC